MIFGTQISSRSRGGLDLIQKNAIFSGAFIPESSFGFHNFSCFSWFFFGYHFEKWLFTSFDQIVRTETEYENTKEHLPRFEKSKTMIFDDSRCTKCKKRAFMSEQIYRMEKMTFRVMKKLAKNEKKHFLSLFFLLWKFLPFSGRNGKFIFISQRFGKFGQTWSLFFRSRNSVAWQHQKWKHIFSISPLHSVLPSQP